MVTLLSVHPSRVVDLRPDELHVAPALQMETLIDSFGNRCSRFVVWFEAFLKITGGRSTPGKTSSARNACWMTTDRDASDVAITTSFRIANLMQFIVITEELSADKATGVWDMGPKIRQ